ncbi:VCBS domain-containing protein [Vibrio hippocampi]|uniref:RapA2 cadherin-like domain-containing protein n=1 Tax=Vibrio hippocampi TaxID=654686 RepID=A0ABN8DGE9_9VIBR|nr:VCBS domain-containing protein [Vibrio hippocampi]CAH0524444.1 hypothetical protein VHP8226_00271 [Vibrio hippocampi]
MYKKLLLASAVVGLTACGGESTSSGTDPGSDNTPAVIAGTDTASIYSTSTSVSESLTITDVDAGEAEFVSSSATEYGTFTISTSGDWTYKLDTTNSDVVALASGETLTESITVSSVDGTQHTVTITITAPSSTNTPAVIAGTDTASIDSTATSVSESLTITDDDAGEAEFVSSSASKYGTFTISASGDWTYELDTTNSDVVALASGETLTESITVSSVDGTQHTITITITAPTSATNTPAVIAGTDTASIYSTATSVSESLTITDDDAGEAEFVSSSASKYGTFTISASGDWTYELDATNSDVVALASGETLTESITVTSVDGTQHTVTITIEYADEGVLITPTLPNGVLTIPEVDCTQVFTDADDLADAASESMEAGTTLCLADGTYTSGFEVKFGGAGTKEAPIKIAAENPGKVIFSGGEVSIKMGGSYAQFQGFIFEEPIFSSSFFETRLGSNLEDLCHNCRITENVIVNGKATSSGGIFAHVYGKDIWVDHNIFSGKTAANPMVSINRWVNDEATEEEVLQFIAQGAIVYGNYIANRPPANGKMYADSGDNDYEAVRTGLSATHHYPGNSMVVGNLFENIQGEAEVISNKGTNNVISGNTVRNSYGSITNRHGNTNVISNNFMFGDGFPYAGGLRIVDDGHTITNNYIEGARYQNTSHHGGIVIIGHDGAGDGDNGYQQVENVHIAHNTVVNSVNSVNVNGGGKSKTPKLVYFANNIIDQAVGDVFVDTEDGIGEGSVYTGNIVYGSGKLAETDDVDATDLGATFMSAALAKAEDGLYRPSDDSPDLTAGSYEKADFADVTQDMDGTARGDTTQVGADDINTDTATVTPLEYADVGPQSYSYEKPAAIMVEAEIANADFEDGLTSWSGGSIIDTDAGAFAGNSLLVSGSATASQSDIALTASEKYAVSAFVKGTYSIVVNDHVFEGEETSSNYTYVIHEFETGVDETTGTITLKVADEVTVDSVVDGNLDNWKNDSGSLGVWDTVEDSDGGLGDVGSSSDSAFDGGSVRIRFKEDEGDIHDFTVKPSVSQSITDVATGVDLTYSLYYCDKKGDDSLTTLHYGVKDGSGNIIADARTHVSKLDDAPEGSNKDCFKQVTLVIADNTAPDVEIFATLEVDTDTMSSDTGGNLYAHEQYLDDDLEVRVDEFVLSYQGKPADDAEAMLDEVRLVKRTIDELSD